MLNIKRLTSKKSSHKSALSENNSSDVSGNIGENSAEKIKALRRKKVDTSKLIEEIIQGNNTALSQAITIIESEQPTHQENAKKIIDGCLPHANQSLRIGITGVPGVGKSTFIEAFGNYLINEHQKKSSCFSD